MSAPAPALFDTLEYSPLFAGLPVAAEHELCRGVTIIDHAAPKQAAWCCSQCGAAGPFIRTRDGGSLCYACARQQARRKKA